MQGASVDSINLSASSIAPFSSTRCFNLIILLTVSTLSAGASNLSNSKCQLTQLIHSRISGNDILSRFKTVIFCVQPSTLSDWQNCFNFKGQLLQRTQLLQRSLLPHLLNKNPNWANRFPTFYNSNQLLLTAPTVSTYSENWPNCLNSKGHLTKLKTNLFTS